MGVQYGGAIWGCNMGIWECNMGVQYGGAICNVAVNTRYNGNN